jgi:hypothetical protein
MTSATLIGRVGSPKRRPPTYDILCNNGVEIGKRDYMVESFPEAVRHPPAQLLHDAHDLADLDHAPPANTR